MQGKWYQGPKYSCEYMNMCVWMQDVLRVARMPMLWDQDFWYPTAWLFSSKPLPGSSLGPLEGHSSQLQWFPSIHQVGTCRRNALRGEKRPNPSAHTTSHTMVDPRPVLLPPASSWGCLSSTKPGHCCEAHPPASSRRDVRERSKDSPKTSGN